MATPGKSARSAASGAAAGVLTSRDNRWLKEFRLALRGGLPTESGAVGVEGVRLVEEALRSGCRIEAVLLSESGERHHERLAPLVNRPEIAFPTLRTTDRLFEGLADTEHPQGVAALVHPRTSTLDELLQAPAAACAVFLWCSQAYRIQAMSEPSCAPPQRSVPRVLSPQLPANRAPPVRFRRKLCAPPLAPRSIYQFFPECRCPFF